MSDIIIKLTQYSHGAGCGCKIAPKVLEEILQNQWSEPDQNLLVGNHSKDDAAVYDMGNGQALISTTDFFTPIVDDPYTFGQIAAANAISDVYAMGGRPLLAIAILGWPVEKLAPAIASRVIAGGRKICAEAGIVLAGGHSIDSLEPIFGLAVNGTISITNIKKNSSAKPGDLIFLTKPIGVGILSTAEKKEKLLKEHTGLAAKQMVVLNKVGEALGNCKGVTAMTDVTGFGLGGHLIEIAEGSGVSVQLQWQQIPMITDLSYYMNNRIFPDATFRNWNAYGSKIGFEKGVPVSEAFSLLPDPQTNGGLLFTVNPPDRQEVIDLLLSYQLDNHIYPIGKILEREEKLIKIE
jgi:selenide, water dikinase